MSTPSAPAKAEDKNIPVISTPATTAVPVPNQPVQTLEAAQVEAEPVHARLASTTEKFEAHEKWQRSVNAHVQQKVSDIQSTLQKQHAMLEQQSDMLSKIAIHFGNKPSQQEAIEVAQAEQKAAAAQKEADDDNRRRELAEEDHRARAQRKLDRALEEEGVKMMFESIGDQDTIPLIDPMELDDTFDAKNMAWAQGRLTGMQGL